jgi:hypothetical protein
MDTKTIAFPKINPVLLNYTFLSLSFLIPLFVSGPQLLTGTLVNAFLFLSVSQSSSKRLLPIIILPSIGAVLNGILFGVFTPFLLYFLPFVWIANYVLIVAFQQSMKHSSFPMAVVISAVLKCTVLFLIAYVLTYTKVVPMMFLQAMGLIQLTTALIGGLLAFLIHKLISKKV